MCEHGAQGMRAVVERTRPPERAPEPPWKLCADSHSARVTSSRCCSREEACEQSRTTRTSEIQPRTPPAAARGGRVHRAHLIRDQRRRQHRPATICSSARRPVGAKRCSRGQPQHGDARARDACGGRSRRTSEETYSNGSWPAHAPPRHRDRLGARAAQLPGQPLETTRLQNFCFFSADDPRPVGKATPRYKKPAGGTRTGTDRTTRADKSGNTRQRTLTGRRSARPLK